MSRLTDVRSYLQALILCSVFFVAWSCTLQTDKKTTASATGPGAADINKKVSVSQAQLVKEGKEKIKSTEDSKSGIVAKAAAKLNPTLVPSAAWLPKPTDVPGSKAETESEMKPYTEKITDTKMTFDMVPIPGGTFMLGSPKGEKNREACEGPQIKVEIGPFWMGKYEVTWDEYDLWMVGLDADQHKEKGATINPRDKLADAITRPTNPYDDMTFGMGRDGYPAISMTHFAAEVYCKWLSAKTGRYYRLPTEAEWEYACRAGTTTAYSFGDNPEKLGEYAWFAGNSNKKYHKIGLKKPNPWNLYDMHGNVAEWVLGRYTDDGYKCFAGKGIIKNPLMSTTKIYGRIVRGGSWMDEAQWLRSAARTASDPSWKEQDPQFPQSIWYLTDAQFVGFRVVRPLKVPVGKDAARYDADAVQKKSMISYNKFKGI